MDQSTREIYESGTIPTPPYNESDICAQYNRAKNKQAAIAMMAHKYRCKESRIRRTLQENGVVLPDPQPAPLRGIPAQQEELISLARAGLGTEPPDPEDLPPARPKGQKMIWNQERKNELRRYHEEGLTSLEIAERMGCTKSAVDSQLTRQRLRQQPTDRPKTAGADQPEPKQPSPPPKGKQGEEDPGGLRLLGKTLDGMANQLGQAADMIQEDPREPRAWMGIGAVLAQLRYAARILESGNYTYKV